MSLHVAVCLQVISLQTSEDITGLDSGSLLQTRQRTQGKSQTSSTTERGLCFAKARDCQGCGWVEDWLMLQPGGV